MSGASHMALLGRASLTWQTLLNPTLNANDPGYTNYCIVCALPTLTKIGSAYRATITPATSGANLVLSSMWLGMLGSAPSWDGNQTQFLVGGSGGFTVTAGGSDVVTDPLVNNNMNTIGTPAVAFGITSGDFRRNTGLSGYTSYYKAADAANAGTTSKAGYSTVTTSLFGLVKLEVLAP